MRPLPLPRMSRPVIAVAVVIAVAIASTAFGAEDTTIAMREPRPALELASSAPHPESAAAPARPTPPAAQSASLRFWRDGGQPEAAAPDDFAAVTVVIADTRSPCTHDGVAGAVAIWRDGGER